MAKYSLKSKKSVVEEPQVINSYRSSYQSDIALLYSSKKGLEAKAALDFIQISGFNQQEFQDIFHLTVKSVQNYSQNKSKLDAAVSEKLLKGFALFDLGIEVFGSAAAFREWINTPSFGLGNVTPVSLMDTFTGFSLIENELQNIAHGNLA